MQDATNSRIEFKDIGNRKRHKVEREEEQRQM